MVKLEFKNKILEKIFRRFKWTRNNTILLFENYIESKNPNKELLYQFQCIVTTTDTYWRKFTDHIDNEFGKLIYKDKIYLKKNVDQSLISVLLDKQARELENLLRDFDANRTDKEVNEILAIMNHEYLHQGQLIQLFYEEKIEFPERFAKAWALS
jgi:hypothetical protein